MIYRLRTTSGAIEPASAGTLIDRDGSTRHLGASEFALEPRTIWRSTLSGTSYPVAWKLAVPSAGIDCTVEPRLSACEFDARASLGIEVLSARRHANKLRRGHSIGNRFDVLIEDVSENALVAARAIAREIGLRGLPNFYGPQRFGADAKNAERGRRLLDAPRNDARSRLMLSALQSHLFNAWLAERMRIGRFDVVSAGDVAKRVDNGALFDVVEEEAENARMRKHEITYTGPMFGARMRPAHGAAGELEGEILRRHEIDAADFARARLDGSRRAARIFVDDLEIVGEASSVRARFSLPSGAYATVLLRELMKAETRTADIDDEA